MTWKHGRCYLFDARCLLMTVMNWILFVLFCFWNREKRKQKRLHRNNDRNALTAKVFLSIFRVDSLARINFKLPFFDQFAMNWHINGGSNAELLTFENESSSFYSVGLLETFGRNFHNVDKVGHLIVFFSCFGFSILNCTCIKFFALCLDENGKVVWKLSELISWAEWPISGRQRYSISSRIKSAILKQFGSHSWANTNYKNLFAV